MVVKPFCLLNFLVPNFVVMQKLSFVWIVLVVLLMSGCLNRTSKSDNVCTAVSEPTASFTVQELYLIENLSCEYPVVTKEDSLALVQKCKMEITYAMLNYPESMNKFPTSYEYTEKSDYLYKQYRYALKIFKEKGEPSLRERVEKMRQESRDIYESLK